MAGYTCITNKKRYNDGCSKCSGCKILSILHSDVCWDDRELMIEMFEGVRRGGRDFAIPKGYAYRLHLSSLSSIDRVPKRKMVVGAMDFMRVEAEANGHD